ncbi:MAG: RHS repeat-associated core domain-containing protein, partial [Coriobacteriia bacterium]
RYLWGPDRTPLSVAVEYSTGATETFAYHTDALGSVVAMTDEAGSIVARYAYGPYGACTLVTGDPIAARNPLRYRAYYADAETGMFYLPARYYDPATYRFLSRDPAAPSAGDPLSLNAYAYCLGDPVGASDPSGATTDYDGNGKLDTWDSSEESGAHAKNPHAKRYHRAMAKARYYEAQLRRAEFALQESGGSLDANFGVFEIGQIRTAQTEMRAGYKGWTGGSLEPDDGTAYGRYNLVLRPTPAHPLKLGFEIVSLCPGFGWLIDGGLTAYDYHGWQQGNGSLGSVGLEASGFIPGIGEVIDATATFVDFVDCTLSYGFGQEHMPIYASPRDQG